MARIKDWMDLAELGDGASLLAHGWSTLGRWGPFVTTNPFHDALGNGGVYSIGTTVTSLGNEDSGWVSPVLASPVVTWYSRFHFYMSTLPNGGEAAILQWRKGTTVLGTLTVTSTGHIRIYSGATLLATSTNVINAAAWYTVELQMTIGTVGSYEVRINNTSVGWIPAASGNTKPGSDTNVDNLYYVTQRIAADVTCYFDDIGADDATWCGEWVMSALHPNGNGTTIQLTGVPLTNWQNIDEIPPSDADYNDTLVANKKDTYVHTSLPGAASAVKCVMIAARVVRTGSAIGTAYPVTRSAGTDYETAGQPIPPAAAIITDIRETDPATGLPWAVAAVNSSEIGIRFDV